MANDIVPWVYVGDDARSYVTGINSEITTQLNGGSDPKIGSRAAVVADAFPPLPSSVKPRRAYLKNAAGKGRTVTVMEPTADLALIGTTLSIEDSDGSASTYTVRRVHAENFGRSRI